MENLKKKLKIVTDILLNRCCVLLFVCAVMLLYGHISYANDTPPILQKLFDYADTYYNFDNTGKTDIISNELKSVLQFIHFNKNTYKAYYEQFANKEHYNDLNACFLRYSFNGSMYLTFAYVPNNSNNDNYGHIIFDGSTNIPLYTSSFLDRINIFYNTNTNNFDNVSYINANGSSVTLDIAGSSFNSNYIRWSNCVYIYNDNIYYSSVPNFDGFASYFVTNSNQRLNGMSDFGFFNLDIQNNNNSTNFGSMYVGSGFVKNGFQVYLVNYDTGDILDNQIYYFSTGGIYNGRYIYQLVLEDFTGINRDTNYRLICSTSNSDFKPFYSQSFKIDYSSVSGDIPTGTIIISGDYQGVGSGDGFNQAINDINNNLNVVNNNISNINNNIKGIGNYISDSSSPNDTLNSFFSGDYEDFAQKMGYSSLENNFYDYLKSTFQSIINAINVPIPNYDIHNKGQSITFEFQNNSFTLTTWDLNPFWVGYRFSNVPNGEVLEERYLALRIIISVFTNGFICYLIIKRFASWIVKLQTLDFNVVNNVDTDINLF